MKTNKNIAKATQAYFTTAQVAVMLNTDNKSVSNFITTHKELTPKIKDKKGYRYLWSREEVERVIDAYMNKRPYNRKPKSETTTPETTITIPETNKSTSISTANASVETLIDMFNTFLYEEQEEEHNENRCANRKFKNLFESMTETDIQKFFEPLTERFKFSYVTKIVEEVQSQTLTCIRKGKLKGIAKYELTYKAFLHLCKFAAENNCPLNLPQQEV